MSSFSKILTILLVATLLPASVLAQSTVPTTAGATPLSANFDIWPEFLPLNNGFHNYDLTAIGVDPTTQREEFVVFGVSNDTECGPKMAIISPSGVETAVRDAFVDDAGTQFLGAAAIANYGAAQGFAFRANVDGDPTSGQFLLSTIFFNNSVPVTFTGVTVSAFDYLASDMGSGYINDHYMSQRYTRDAAKVSNMAPGRNIPSATSHTLSPWFPAATHESRAPGCAILSNGNSLHYICDLSRQGSGSGLDGVAEYYVDKGLVPALDAGTSHQCNLHTVTDAAATAFVVNTTPTFVNPDDSTTFQNSNSQQADAGQGWFAMRADNNNGSLAFFRNDGTRIDQVYNYKALYEDTDGLLPNTADTITVNGANAMTAAADTLFVVARYQEFSNGIDRPAVLRFRVNPALTAVTALPIIVADDDYTTPSTTSVNESTIDIHANSSGCFVIGWRRNAAETTGADAPVARVYKADGSPSTGSFYVSSLADPASDTESPVLNGQVKVAMNDNVVCVSWFTENGVTTVNSNDCSGTPKGQAYNGAAISTAARFFQVDLTEIGNWDLY